MFRRMYTMEMARRFEIENPRSRMFGTVFSYLDEKLMARVSQVRNFRAEAMNQRGSKSSFQRCGINPRRFTFLKY